MNRLHSKKFLKLSKFLSRNHRRNWIFKPFQYHLFIIGSILFFVILLLCIYIPISETVVSGADILSNGCNLFDGKWVISENYPLYNASDCPLLERSFDCLGNGRKDKGYLNWRWEPQNCEIPRFDVNLVLEFLRGKRVVFVGDSLSRTQWESMICMLMSGVKDKKSVYEVNGNKITKQIKHLVVRFSTFSLNVEFYRSVFLVRSGMVPRHSPKRVKAVVKLDSLDEVSREWIDADVLVFNSGHWWTPTKLFDIQGLVFSDRWKDKARNDHRKRLQVRVSYLAILASKLDKSQQDEGVLSNI